MGSREQDIDEKNDKPKGRGRKINTKKTENRILSQWNWIEPNQMPRSSTWQNAII